MEKHTANHPSHGRKGLSCCLLSWQEGRGDPESQQSSYKHKDQGKIQSQPWAPACKSMHELAW